MTRTATVVNKVIRFLIRLVLKVGDAELATFPAKGPLIVVGNHLNLLEVPLMYSHLYPRPVTGWAKEETLKNPFYNWLFHNAFHAITVKRGEIDQNAVAQALQALKDGYILAVSPEGTRSYDGRLQPAKPGVVLLAVKSKAPILPMTYYGHELIWKRLLTFRRAPFLIRIGHPFTIDTHGEALSRDIRQEIADEIMYQMAALLPPDYRGVYSDMSQAREMYVHFEPGVESNLKRMAETDLLPRLH